MTVAVENTKKAEVTPTPVEKKQVEKKEMLIDGRIYDVTNFIKRHPGGSIINFVVGSDASDHFTQMHYRSERAKKMLKVLPSRE